MLGVLFKEERCANGSLCLEGSALRVTVIVSDKKAKWIAEPLS